MNILSKYRLSVNPNDRLVIQREAEKNKEVVSQMHKLSTYYEYSTLIQLVGDLYDAMVERYIVDKRTRGEIESTNIAYTMGRLDGVKDILDFLHGQKGFTSTPTTE